MFETLPIHTNCLHLSTEHMMILCFYPNCSHIYYLLLHIYVFVYLMYFYIFIFISVIKNMSTSVNNSNLVFVFFKDACRANLGANRK